MTAADGRVFVGVAAVVVHDGRLLMVRRAGAHGAGSWSVPGGWQERGELIEQTAVREVAEETGAQVRALGAWSPAWTTGTVEQMGTPATTLWVRCEYLSGEPTVLEPAKCPEVEWVPLDQVADRALYWPLAQVAHHLVRTSTLTC